MSVGVGFDAENVVQKGNTLTLDLLFNVNRDRHGTSPPPTTKISPVYKINSVVTFSAKIVWYNKTLLFLVRFGTMRSKNRFQFSIQYNHKFSNNDEDELWPLSELRFSLEDDCTYMVGEYPVNYNYIYTFNVSIVVTPAVRFANPCSNVYDDTELADVELRGADGSVHLHKAIAAAWSPVMRTSFTGEWGKESKYVIDAPPDTTQESLQHLKDYMYMNKLPSTGKENLLLLASFYMIPELEWLCSQELMSNIKAEEAYKLFEFAMKHQMSQLIFEIMHRVQNGILDVNEIQKYQKW